METLLTTSYQKIAEKSLSIGKLRTYAKYTTQNKDNRTTTIKIKSVYYVPSSSSYVGFSSGSNVLDGTTKNYNSYTRFESGETTIQELTRTINHNSDGTSSTKNISNKWTATFGGNATISASVYAPTMNIQSKITCSNIMTIGTPIDIDITKYINNYVTDLVAKYSTSNGVLKTINISEDVETGTVQFNPEKTSIYNDIINQKYVDFTIIATTYSNFDRTSIIGTSIVTTKCNFIEEDLIPTLTYTFEETDQNVINLIGTTGNNIIKSASKPKITSVITYKNGATLSSIVTSCNDGQVLNTNPAIFNSVSSNIFKIKLIDSRGYIIEENITKVLINYLPIEINAYTFKRGGTDSENVILNADIQYFISKFDDIQNIPTIKYKVNSDGTPVIIPNEDYTISTTENKISIYNLDLGAICLYNQQYTLYLYVEDLLTSDTENYVLSKAIPTFDYGENDFNINGVFTISDENGENPINVSEYLIKLLKEQTILWQGSSFMQSGQTANLRENISDQKNGIVLIFSQYTNGAANDYDYSTHFIPKKFVESYEGKGFDFILSTSNFNLMSSKYLYISDDHITGHANNNATGTAASGIKYTNNRFVLRYVIGV